MPTANTSPRSSKRATTATTRPAARKPAAAKKAPTAKVAAKKAPTKAAAKKTAVTKRVTTKKAAAAAPRVIGSAVGPTAAKTARATATTKRVAAAPAVAATAPMSRALRDLYAQHGPALAPIWDPRTGLSVDLKVPASTTLYPQRTRCKACRAGLGNLVVLRMFCSYRCARLPAPATTPEAAPRMCKRAARTDERGEWAFKNKYATTQEAQAYLRPGMTIYRCEHCFFLHLGNQSAPPKPGVPQPPAATGNGLFDDCVVAVLAARGESPDAGAAVAAAKRDVRAVFEIIKRSQAGGSAIPAKR